MTIIYDQVKIRYFNVTLIDLKKKNKTLCDHLKRWHLKKKKIHHKPISILGLEKKEYRKAGSQVTSLTMCHLLDFSDFSQQITYIKII